jgi:squalene-hopene/tetraprenyl-beta-curcumene cyclase
VNQDRIQKAYRIACDTLLAEMTPQGHWVGELSSSALSTATTVSALHLANHPDRTLIHRGIEWLVEHQNEDGGWGDTVLSFSNISTTMLCRAAFHITGKVADHQATLLRCEKWLEKYGTSPEELAEAIRQRYGTDRTFSVPILMMSALGGLVPWKEVPRLPFELACLPQSWYRFARLPVVSYALPALIAIGQVIHHHRSTWNPITLSTRFLGKKQSLRVLERIQPSSGGYLEASPLTSFVVMSLASIPNLPDSGQHVIQKGIEFLVNSVCADGSWAIDSNLSIWVTTLSVNALQDELSLEQRETLRSWILSQQTKEVHPFTGAAPGAWGWSHLPGSVPDCDDTPGAILALSHLGKLDPSVGNGIRWMADLQNSDGGMPTFCRGWGKLPFDRSGTDLTAHALRAIHLWEQQANGPIDRDLVAVQMRAWKYLAKHQRSDGSWLPLWFGNQHAPDDINPVYGTARVLAAYRDLGKVKNPEAQHGMAYLISVQNEDGGWGGDRGSPSSIEETALVIEVLWEMVEDRSLLNKGVEYLVKSVDEGTFTKASPIGFYFAKLWYFEKLYPLIFTVAALRKISVVH